jgi:hypothetical protein
MKSFPIRPVGGIHLVFFSWDKEKALPARGERDEVYIATASPN